MLMLLNKYQIHLKLVKLSVAGQQIFLEFRKKR